MKKYYLADMKKGWFVGNFTPAALQAAGCEVAYRLFKKGAHEDRHLHRVATEVTLIVAGRARLHDQVLETGDIIVLEPGEAADFEALTDGATVVVKVPSVPGDKYPTPL